MKVATFTVRATEKQSARWKQAAQAEGHASVGTWLAGAADAYLKVRASAGLPIPLSWRPGVFGVRLSTGETARGKGKMAPPFAYYEGTETEPSDGRGRRRFTLVYVPTGRVLGTFLHTSNCKALASELARLWVRWGGTEPAEDPAPLLQRFQREDV